jgi:hypothetical protein
MNTNKLRQDSEESLLQPTSVPPPGGSFLRHESRSESSEKSNLQSPKLQPLIDPVSSGPVNLRVTES